MWKSSLMVELTPSGSFCLGWACAVSQSVPLLVGICWSCERSPHTRGAGGLSAREQRPRARERKQRVGREKGEEKSESRWRWWRIDRWFVNLRGFDRSISSPLPSPFWRSRTSWEMRESEFLPGARGYNLLLSRGLWWARGACGPPPRGFSLR